MCSVEIRTSNAICVPVVYVSNVSYNKSLDGMLNIRCARFVHLACSPLPPNFIRIEFLKINRTPRQCCMSVLSRPVYVYPLILFYTCVVNGLSEIYGRFRNNFIDEKSTADDYFYTESTVLSSPLLPQLILLFSPSARSRLSTFHQIC